MGGEIRFGGGADMRVIFEGGHLVEELVNVRDVGGNGEADSGEQRRAGGWRRSGGVHYC